MNETNVNTQIAEMNKINDANTLKNVRITKKKIEKHSIRRITFHGKLYVQWYDGSAWITYAKYTKSAKGYI